MDKEKELESIKKLLSSLIISSSRGLTASRLLFDYRNEIGKDIPFRNMGFKSFDMFLLSLTDVCRLHGTGPNAVVEPVVNEKVKHINDMILRQKPPKHRGRVSYRPTGVQIQAPPKKDYSQIQLPQLVADPTKVIGPPPIDYQLERLATDKSPNNKKKKARSNSPLQNFDYYAAEYQSSLETQHIDNKTSETQEAKTENETGTAKEIPYEPDPDLCYRDNDEFEDGQCSEVDFISSDEDFIYESDSNEEKNSHLSPENKNRTNLNSCDESELQALGATCSYFEETKSKFPLIGKRITEEMRNNLAVLIAENQDGIWCSKLLETYSRRFGSTFDPYDYGFQSISQMCEALPEIFHVVRPGKGDWKLFDKNLPKPDVTDIEEWVEYIKKFYHPPKNDEVVAPFPDEIAPEPAPITYPDEVLPLGSEIEWQEMPSTVKLNEYVNIIISEIYDPSKFWFQLKDEYEKLNTLMDDLQIFYNTNYAQYKMDLRRAQVGLYCAALILNEFHRGVICKVYDDSSVKIFFFDYGTVADVNMKKVCFLHEQFSYLPRQALRAKLSNIIPIEQNTMWSRGSSRRFLEMIADKNLVGYLTHIDYTNYIFSFIVTDITDDDIDIHINDTLIDEGYAIPGNKADLCPTSRAILPNIHLYPTFNEIENGYCPTVADLDRFEKLGFDLQDVFINYFNPKNNTYNPDSLFYSNSEIDHLEASCSNLTLDDISTSENLTQSETSLQQNQVTESSKNSQLSCDKPNYNQSEREDSASGLLDKSVVKNEDISKSDNYNWTGDTCSSQKIKLPPGLPIPNNEPKTNLADNSKMQPDEPYNQLTSLPQTSGETNSTHLEKYNSLTITYQYLKVLIINQSASYDKDIFQMLILHLNDCDHILRLFLIANDPTERLLLSNRYIEKVTVIKNILDIQKLQKSVLTIQPNMLPIQQNFLPMQQNMLPMQQFMQPMQQFIPAMMPMQQMNVPSMYQPQMSPPNPVFLPPNQGFGLDLPNVVNQPKNIQKIPCEINQQENQNVILTTNSKNNNFINDTSDSKELNDETNSNSDKSNTDSEINSSNKNCTESYKIDLRKKLEIKNMCIFDVATDNFKIHILKIENDFYMSTQEMITVLLESKDKYTTWVENCSINCPSRVVNLKCYKEIFEQIKNYNIPGIQGEKAIGCYVRLTLMKQVPRIVYLLGKKEFHEDIDFIVQSLET